MRPIPSLVSIFDKIDADLKARLDLVDGELKSGFEAMAGVFAAQLKECYYYLQDLEDNIFPDKADTAANGGTLERQGLMQLRRLPFPAKNGIYVAAVQGVAGATLRAGLTFVSDDSSVSPGNVYILDNEYIMPGTVGSITIRSLMPGLDYILAVGDQLTASEPILGADEHIVLTAVTQAPEAGESEDTYRQAILDALILESQGGAKADYRIWAADAQGVRKVYPYVKQGEAGTVQVFVEAVTEDSTDGHGTPQPSLLNDVEAVIEFDPDTTIMPSEFRGRRPAQANVVALAITPKPVDIIIQGIQSNTVAVRAAVNSAVVEYLYDVRPYIAGADLIRDKNDVLTAVKLQSIITTAIGSSNTFLDFSLFVDGVQVNTFTFSLSNIPYLRNVTYS